MTKALKPPIFIGGMYKSGTSLLRAMLGRHPRIASGLETGWMHVDWETGQSVREEWADRLAGLFDEDRPWLHQLVLNAASPEAVVDRLMARVADRAGKARWAEKTPGNAGVLDRIFTHWPDAAFIHVVRDYRDVYASLVEARKWVDPVEFAGHWAETAGAAFRWHAGRTPEQQGRYLEVRYERLALRPERTMGQVLEFVDEAFVPEVAAFQGQSDEYERVKRVTGKDSSTLKRLAQPLTDGRIGIWRDSLSGESIAAIESELARLGFSDELARQRSETRNILEADAGGAR